MNDEARDPPEIVDEVLGRPRRFTSGEVVAAVGVPMYRARRFWRALGFGNVAADAAEFTEADIAALRLLTEFVDSGAMSEDQVVRMVRVLGRTSARLAGAQLDTLSPAPTGPVLHDADPAQRLLPQLEQLLVYAWRRHVAAELPRHQPTTESTVATESAVGFADLVGFTSLSRRLSAPELALLVDRFEHRASEIIAECRGRLIKSLGDEVLFAADEPTMIGEIGLRLVQAYARDTDLPGIRVGLAIGEVLSHLGDLYGHTVNLANRLTRMTEPNSVLIGPELTKTLTDDPRYTLVQIGSVTVRGIGPIAPALLERATTGQAYDVSGP